MASATATDQASPVVLLSVDLDAGLLWIDSQYDAKDRIKTLPGHRWSSTRKQWSVPATPWSAIAVLSAFGWGGVDYVDGEAKRFVELASGEATARQRVLDVDQADLATPRRIAGDLWDHQLKGYHWIGALRSSLLYWGMGTGKSRTVIDSIRNRGHLMTLVVCPKSVIGCQANPDDPDDPGSGWGRQVDLFGGGDVRFIGLGKGSTKKKAGAVMSAWSSAKSRGQPTMIVVNYDSFWRDPLMDVLRSIDWSLIVYDEIHRLKSPGGKASKAGAGLSAGRPRVVGLSGTPMPHSPLDIYGVYRALDPGIFGTNFTIFRARYALLAKRSNSRGQEFQTVVGYQNQADLSERFYRLAYHVPDDAVELPPVTVSTRSFELGRDARRMYDEMEREYIVEIGSDEITAANAGARLMKLRELAGGFIYDDDGKVVELDNSDKRATFSDLLEDVGQDEPIVVFCVFRPELDHVAEAAREAGRTTSELSGRVDQLAEWQRGETNTMIVQIQSGSEGIDLTRAAINVYYTLDWSLGTYKQSRKRSHRPGQDRPVRVIHLAGRKTTDEIVSAALERREDVIDHVLHRLRARAAEGSG